MDTRGVSHTLRAGEEAQRSAGIPGTPSCASPPSLPDEPFTMVITVTPGDSLLLVELTGELDEMTTPDLRRAFAAFSDHNAPLIVFDMSRVPYVDSDGFGTLINIQKRLAESGRSLVLVGCQEAVRVALALTRLEVLFPHYPSLHDIPERRA